EKQPVGYYKEKGEPPGKPSVIRIDIAPIADAQGNDGAQEQAFIGNRIENCAERAPLFVTTSDISVEAVARGRNEKNHDRRKTLPFKRRTALDALAIIDSHRDESRNHQNPNDCDFIGRRHSEARDER